MNPAPSLEFLAELLLNLISQEALGQAHRIPRRRIADRPDRVDASPRERTHAVASRSGVQSGLSVNFSSGGGLDESVGTVRLARSLKASTLLAVGHAVPGFLARTAAATEPGKETVLVVVGMSGGNDGLNTVMPSRTTSTTRRRPTLAPAAVRHSR